MTRARYYTARHGLIWSACSGNVRTITEAETSLPHLADMAVSARTDDLSQDYLAQFADLVSAIREAKAQERDVPVREAA